MKPRLTKKALELIERVEIKQRQKVSEVREARELLEEGKGNPRFVRGRPSAFEAQEMRYRGTC